MKILIISRQAEETRRRFQQQQMKQLGLNYEFLDAFGSQRPFGRRVPDGSKQLAKPDATPGRGLLHLATEWRGKQLSIAVKRR